jgi:predicted small secreted protein
MTMKRIKRYVFGILLIGVLSILLSGCNTVEGMGEDIERGGEEIQDVAD